MKQEKNGFTLIELLAVIVVLAILILFAMPAITAQTEKARRSAFATEAAEIIRMAGTTYTTLSGSGANTAEMCLPIRGMVAIGDLDKNVGNLTGDDAAGHYEGSVLVTIGKDGLPSYSIWLENGTLSLIQSGTSFKINDVEQTKTYSTGVNICGEKASAIPAELKRDVRYVENSTTGKRTTEVVPSSGNNQYFDWTDKSIKNKSTT